MRLEGLVAKGGDLHIMGGKTPKDPRVATFTPGVDSPWRSGTGASSSSLDVAYDLDKNMPAWVTEYFGKRFCVSSNAGLKGRPQLGSKGFLELYPMEEALQTLKCVASSENALLLLSVSYPEHERLTTEGLKNVEVLTYPKLEPPPSKKTARGKIFELPLPFCGAGRRATASKGSPPDVWSSFALDASWAPKLLQTPLGPTETAAIAEKAGIGLGFKTSLTFLAYLAMVQPLDNSPLQAANLLLHRKSFGIVQNAQEAYVLGRIAAGNELRELNRGDTGEDIVGRITKEILSLQINTLEF